MHCAWYTLVVTDSLSSVCREVFKARNRENKRLVALKKVLMENEKEGVSCFL
jgi:hypothetical protein